jgi:multidrug efflux pump subunit AcrA (membrane-fusion protein)
VPAAAALVVVRGPLLDRQILSAEAEAIAADKLAAPRTPNWQLTIHWLAEDGALLKRGEKVAEFDSSALSGNIEDRRLAVIRGENELEKSVAQATVTLSDKQLEIERQKSALAMALIDAQVPAELLPQQDYQKRQLALAQVRDALTRAEESLAAEQRAAELDKTTKEIALLQAQRELQTLTRRRDDMTLVASRDGYLQIERGMQGRKYVVGDQVYSSQVLATLPEFGAMQLRARLSDVDDGAVAIGMAADCILDAYPDQSLAGIVQSVSPVARAESRESTRRSFEVVVTLRNKAPEHLRPGMSARVEVIRRRAEGALLIPRQAVPRWPGAIEVRLQSGATAHLVVDFCDELWCVVQGGVLEGTQLLAASSWAGSQR